MKQQETNTATLPTPLLTQTEVARMLGKSESWLERCRWLGTGGPAYKKVGRSVRYKLETVLKFIEDQPTFGDEETEQEGVKK